MTARVRLPLEDAAERLRKRPGRPRTRPVDPPAGLESGHGGAQGAARARLNSGAEWRPGAPSTPALPLVVAVVAAAPARLLDLASVGVYLGLSHDSIKKLDRAGRLPRVKVPGLRRTLVDRVALDAAVEAWRELTRPVIAEHRA